jgi:hypothetical protein
MCSSSSSPSPQSSSSSSSPLRILAAVAVFAALSTSLASAQAPPIDGTTYNGWGTYYGTPPMAPNTFVHCHLPNIDQTDKYQGVSRTIAVNGAQYGGSAACGMCAEVWGSGKLCDGGVQGPDCGLGQQGNAIHERFLAVVTDELWERGYGDIDIGVQGDGKYPVQWKPVPCPWAKTSARLVLHAGSSVNYIKAQMRYMDSGMKWMKNEGSGEVSNYRFHDNFFVFAADSGIGGWDAKGELTFRVESTLGSHYCGKIDRAFQAEPYEYTAWPC